MDKMTMDKFLAISDDKLNRKEFLNQLFNFFNNFGNQSGHGLTIILNGKYGSGKSTLLNFIVEKNIQNNNEFNVLTYNAWKNNYYENAMVPILYTISKLEPKGSKLKESALNVVKKIPKIIISSLANAHSVDLLPLLENENIFNDYDSYKEAVNKFGTVLNDYCKNKKTIFLIDELDRCLPEYQINVLECIYHLLDIPNLIVLIALDREILEQAIINKFGQKLNICSYLAKFIQYQIDLPQGDLHNFIINTIKFNCEYEDVIKDIIATIITDKLNLSVRESLQFIDILNMVCNEKDAQGNSPNYYYWYPVIVMLLILLRKNYHNVYTEFFVTSDIRENYPNSKKNLEDTAFFTFLSKIKGTPFENVLEYLKNHDYGLGILIKLIDGCVNLNEISYESIAKFTNDEASRVSNIIDGYKWSNGIRTYRIINKIQALIF